MPEKILKQINEVAKKVGVIAKSQRNQQQAYQFRGIDDVLAAVHGPLTEHGVVVTSEIVEWEARDYQGVDRQDRPRYHYQVFLKMRYTFTADDGSSISTEALGVSIDYQDKAANQAMSQAFKMALLQILTSPSGDPDADSRAPHAEQPPVGEPAFDAKPWLDLTSKALIKWSDAERSAAGAVAVAVLKPGKPMTKLEAEKVYAHMSAAYFEQFDADEGGDDGHS